MDNVVTFTDGNRFVAVDVNTVHKFNMKKVADIWSVCIWQQQGQTAFAVADETTAKKIQTFITYGNPFIKIHEMPFKVQFPF